jgi:ribose/xylose/arabinose/galactoside ABC-type transport system permease subunit
MSQETLPKLSTASTPGKAAVAAPLAWPARLARSERARRVLRKAGPLPALLLVLIAGTILSPFFLTHANLSAAIETASVIGLLAVGQGFVIIAGGSGIDLSVGAALGLAAVVGARLQNYGASGVIIGAVGAGLFMGLINGLGVAIGRITPFIMTLGTLTIATGAAYYLSGSNQIVVKGSAAMPVLSSSVLGIPVAILVFAAAVLIGQLVLTRTVFGRQIYVVGGNEDAARFAGVPVDRRRLAVYLISGLCAGVAALLLLSRLQTADPNFGKGYELSAIAAVVVGGAALSGGVGNIFGVAIGVLTIQLISNLLNIMNVNTFVQLMVTGLIVIVVVSLNRDRSDRARARRDFLRLAPVALTLLVGVWLVFVVFGS